MDRASSLVADGCRVVLGITGPPGAGKSTFATGLVALLNLRPCPGSWAGDDEWAVHVPMDGFHLTRAELHRQEIGARRGAPKTFDVGGYVALLRRIAADLPDPVYAPVFDRDVGDAVAGAICVPTSARLIVTEGNYLLLDDPGWLPLRTILDEVWFCDVDEELRRQRLVHRHVRHGMSYAAAAAWAAGSDAANAELVRRSRRLADLTVPETVTRRVATARL